MQFLMLVLTEPVGAGCALRDDHERRDADTTS